MRSILVEWDNDGNIVDFHGGGDASAIDVGDNHITLEPRSYIGVIADVWAKSSDEHSARLLEKFYRMVAA